MDGWMRRSREKVRVMITRMSVRESAKGGGNIDIIVLARVIICMSTTHSFNLIIIE
jgi:hypothetical protein